MTPLNKQDLPDKSLSAVKIKNVRAFAVKIPRDFASGVGGAGSPVALKNEDAAYCRAATYGTVYSANIETTVVQIETDAGITGWGEAQAPVAPEVAATIINTLLAPAIKGADALAPETLWAQMYEMMRVRGQTGGFMLDAIAAVDIAIWDICGKFYNQPIARLLGANPAINLPIYISGLAGANESERVNFARQQVEQGASAFKIFCAATTTECLSLIDRLRAELPADIKIYVDALWRLNLKEAERFADELIKRAVGWLEAPLAPEDVMGHARLAAATKLSIAIGESYRTRFELLPFFERRALGVVQPDAGRTGITEGRKIANLAEAFHVPVAPHISIGLGLQIAAALHLAAATTNLLTVECNPQVYQIANRFLRLPFEFDHGKLMSPTGAGLGCELNWSELERFIV